MKVSWKPTLSDSIVRELEKNSSCKDEFVSVILMDLLKFFDTVNKDFLLANLHAHSFSEEALNFMRSYLKD